LRDVVRAICLAAPSFTVTAASLWMTSSIEVTAGAFMCQIAVAGVMFVMLIVSVLWLVASYLPGGNVHPPGDRRKAFRSLALPPISATGDE
jgi:uncharacterized membrane protein YhiD involved in acid resistance